MRGFGLSLVGLSLVSSVGSFAVGESAILNERDKIVAGESTVLNEQDKAMLDELYGAFDPFVDAVADLFKENSDSSIIKRRSELLSKMGDFRCVVERMLKYEPLDKDAFDSYLRAKETDAMCYAGMHLPVWLLDGGDIISRNESRVPEIHKENHRFLCKALELWGM